jgi:hypothetical protein
LWQKACDHLPLKLVVGSGAEFNISTIRKRDGDVCEFSGLCVAFGEATIRCVPKLSHRSGEKTASKRSHHRESLVGKRIMSAWAIRCKVRVIGIPSQYGSLHKLMNRLTANNLPRVLCIYFPVSNPRKFDYIMRF